jgi:hypothetical protein
MLIWRTYQAMMIRKEARKNERGTGNSSSEQVILAPGSVSGK